MTEYDQILIRKLDPRERRRLNVHAIDPSCSTRTLIEHNQPKLLYRYGCKLEEMNVELQPNSAAVKKNVISRLRGCHHQFLISIIGRPIKPRSLFYWFFSANKKPKAKVDTIIGWKRFIRWTAFHLRAVIRGVCLCVWMVVRVKCSIWFNWFHLIGKVFQPFFCRSEIQRRKVSSSHPTQPGYPRASSVLQRRPNDRCHYAVMRTTQHWIGTSEVCWLGFGSLSKSH